MLSPVPIPTLSPLPIPAAADLSPAPGPAASPLAPPQPTSTVTASTDAAGITMRVSELILLTFQAPFVVTSEPMRTHGGWSQHRADREYSGTSCQVAECSLGRHGQLRSPERTGLSTSHPGLVGLTYPLLGHFVAMEASRVRCGKSSPEGRSSKSGSAISPIEPGQGGRRRPRAGTGRR